jgi:lipopolysaccharide exporter
LNSLLGKLKQTAPAGSFAQSVGMLAGGTVVGQAAALAALPILTRLYSPAEYGAFAIYTSIGLFMLAGASLRYETAIPLPRDDESAAHLLALSVWILLGATSSAGLAIWLLGDAFVRLTHTQALRPYLWLVPVSLLGSGLCQVLTNWALRQKDGDSGVGLAGEPTGRPSPGVVRTRTPGLRTRPSAFVGARLLARTRAQQLLGQVAFQLGLGFLHFGLAGLILGQVVGQMIGAGTLVAAAWRKDQAAFQAVSLAGMRRVAHRYRSFALLASPAALLDTAGTHLPLLLLGAFYSPQVVGWIVLGQRILGLPGELVGSAVAQVYQAEAAWALRSRPEQLDPLFFRTLKGMFWYGLFTIGFLSAVAPSLLSWLFGSRWAETGLYLQLLSVSFLLGMSALPIGGTLDTLERQDLHLARELIRVTVISSAVVLAGALHQPPTTAVLLLSAAGSSVYGVSILASWQAIRTRRRC